MLVNFFAQIQLKSQLIVIEWKHLYKIHLYSVQVDAICTIIIIPSILIEMDVLIYE